MSYVEDLWRKSAELVQLISFFFVVLVVLSVRGAAWHVRRALVVVMVVLYHVLVGVEDAEARFMAVDPNRRREGRTFPRRFLTFATCGDCLSMTRFSEEHLYTLLRCLRLPANLVIKRCNFTSEECLLIFLYKFSNDATFATMAKDKFGGRTRQWVTRTTSCSTTSS